MIIGRLTRTWLTGCCISAIIAAGSYITNAEGALLTDIQGTVLVDHGNGFKSIVESALLVPGDRVHVAAGLAVIVYENDCSQRVEPDQTVVVLAVPPSCSLKDGTTASAGSDIPGPESAAAASIVAFSLAIGTAIANSETETPHGGGRGVSP